MDVTRIVHKPLIYEYDDYRTYLKDLYQHYKSTRPQFSFRYFSRVAGFQSPNFLKLVIDGKRNLTKESLVKFAKALKLTKDESDFLAKLACFNQASDWQEQNQFAEDLVKARSYQKHQSLKVSELSYYQHWYFVSIREMIVLKDFREDYQWIAARLAPAITAIEAKNAIEQLIALGLLARDKEGFLFHVNNVVVTPNEVTSAFVKKYHKEMMRLASESIERFPRERREISSATITVGPENVKKVKELVQKFRNDILALTDSDPAAEDIYQLNFQFFPLTQNQGEGE